MSGRGGRRVSEEQEGNSERWLLTYADMITLLLALFIVLFAFSSIDVKKFLELRMGLTAAFNPSAITEKGGSGLLNQTSLVSTAGSSSSKTPVFVPQVGNGSAPSSQGTAVGGPNASTIANEIRLGLLKAGLAKDASVTTDYRGAVVNILADKVFFVTDSAALGKVGDQISGVIASVIRPDPNGVIVEGFTDNVPVTGGPFTSNWELSAVRASNVVQYLNSTGSIPADRLASAGYGSTDPLASNATPAGRAANRRVDVVILNTQSSTATSSGGATNAY